MAKGWYAELKRVLARNYLEVEVPESQKIDPHLHGLYGYLEVRPHITKTAAILYVANNQYRLHSGQEYVYHLFINHQQMLDPPNTNNLS